MSEFSKNFSFNIRKLRKEKSMTQKELADALQYSEKTVSKWECGDCLPDIDTLFEISRLFCVSIDALFAENNIYYLGIDGGGTKTEFALADKNGKIIRRLKTGMCNPVDIGLDKAKEIIKNGINNILKDISFSSVYLFAGISGGTSAGTKDKLAEFFKEFGFGGFENDSDSKNIIAAGLNYKDGVIVIMGTGICAFSQINGISKKTAGWGYLVDKGGCGYNLGQDALHAYFYAMDGTKKESLITEEVNRLYPGGYQKIMEYIYSEGKKAVASFAPAIISAAEKNDKTAIEILERNMKEAAQIIETSAKDIKDEKVKVVLAGGLTNNPLVISVLLKSFENKNRLDITILKTSPADGAVMMAMRCKKNDKN